MKKIYKFSRFQIEGKTANVKIEIDTDKYRNPFDAALKKAVKHLLIKYNISDKYFGLHYSQAKQNIERGYIGLSVENVPEQTELNFDEAFKELYYGLINEETGGVKSIIDRYFPWDESTMDVNEFWTDVQNSEEVDGIIDGWDFKIIKLEDKKTFYYIDEEFEEAKELSVEKVAGKDESIVVFDNGWVLINDDLLKDDNEKQEYISQLDGMGVYQITGIDLAELEEKELNENPPGYLYHGTSEGAWEMIQESGALRVKSDTRGMANVHTRAAIFTFEDEEAAFNSSYNDGVVLRIDIGRFVKDGNEVKLSREEPLIEEREKGMLAHLIGFNEYIPEEYTSDGLSDDTILIFNNIPLKYVERIEE